MALSLFVVFCWLACVCLHEFGHALVAYIGGDDSIKEKGYLSLNPAKYIDASTSLVFPALIMAMGGIGLPGAAVYINEAKLRNRFWRSATAFAGPLMTFLITVLISTSISQEWVPLGGWISQGLALVVLFNVATTLLNLLPIPPLDGYGVIRPWLPDRMKIVMNQFSGFRMIFLIYMLLSFGPFVSSTLWSVTAMITEWLGVPGELVSAGYHEFHRYSIVVIPVLLLGMFLMRKTKRDVTGVAAPEVIQGHDFQTKSSDTKQ